MPKLRVSVSMHARVCVYLLLLSSLLMGIQLQLCMGVCAFVFECILQVCCLGKKQTGTEKKL